MIKKEKLGAHLHLMARKRTRQQIANNMRLSIEKIEEKIVMLNYLIK